MNQKIFAIQISGRIYAKECRVSNTIKQYRGDYVYTVYSIYGGESSILPVNSIV